MSRHAVGIPLVWTQKELARIAYGDRQLLAVRLAEAFERDRRAQGIASGVFGNIILEHIRFHAQSTWSDPQHFFFDIGRWFAFSVQPPAHNEPSWLYTTRVAGRRRILRYPPGTRLWRLTNRGDPVAARLADHHYSRRQRGSAQFIAPGSSLVLMPYQFDALWVTVYQRYTKHRWPDAWYNSHFRNEGPYLSSDLIREAVAITRWAWQGQLPSNGMITFVDAQRISPKTHPGWCYRMAGFEEVGKTAKGLIVLQLPAAALPAPLAPGR